MMNKNLLLWFFFILLTACTKDEEHTKTIQKKAEIISFNISNNDASGVITKTQLHVEGYDVLSFDEHGLYVYYNDQLVKKLEEGKLTQTTFKSVINV